MQVILYMPNSCVIDEVFKCKDIDEANELKTRLLEGDKEIQEDDIIIQ